jgi:MFS family permease
MGYTEFYNFLIPLYGLSLGMSAGQIGMLVGARSLLAVFLSIHVGALMDRLGTRRAATATRRSWGAGACHYTRTCKDFGCR